MVLCIWNMVGYGFVLDDMVGSFVLFIVVEGGLFLLEFLSIRYDFVENG